MPTDLKTLVTGLYDLLEPADPADREKAIRAALTMLGDDTSAANQKPDKGARNDDEDADDGDNSDFNAKARTWMSRNKVTSEELAHVFHIDGETVDIIVDTVPGKNQKEQAINAYMLTGVAEFLKTGESKFTDKVARENLQKARLLRRNEPRDAPEKAGQCPERIEGKRMDGDRTGDEVRRRIG
jgi:hypothetical protein